MQYVRRNIQLTPEQAEKLRDLAYTSRTSASEHIRIALTDYLNKLTPTGEKEEVKCNIDLPAKN